MQTGEAEHTDITGVRPLDIENALEQSRGSSTLLLRVLQLKQHYNGLDRLFSEAHGKTVSFSQSLEFCRS
jgi:hypothetical protein